MIDEYPVLQAQLNSIMTFFRLGILAAATSLSSCLVTTAPEPPDFKLSDQALSQKYHATRKKGDVRLYAQKIDTTRDEWGSESYLASGGSLLMKESNPPVQAQAASILITREFAEARGKSTVKRNDRLYLGQDDSTKIRIEGTEIILEGPVTIREVATEADPPKTPDLEKTAAADPPPAVGAPPSQPELPKEKPKAKDTPPINATLPAARPSSPPSAPKPKVVPAVDRSRLLNLMREPTDR